MSIDQAVYKHPALCARSRLRKSVVCNCGALDPACPEWPPRTLDKPARGTERDLQCPMDRMLVEGIAERACRRDHIERRYRTVELGRYIGAHPSCTLYSGARAGEAVNVVPAPHFGSRS
jgi:hypothetical protein